MGAQEDSTLTTERNAELQRTAQTNVDAFCQELMALGCSGS